MQFGSGQMRLFVRLAISECKAEFPMWEILQATRVWDVASNFGLDGDWAEDVRRLAQEAGVDPDDLTSQMLRSVPAAKRFWSEQGKPQDVAFNVTAWKHVLQH